MHGLNVFDIALILVRPYPTMNRQSSLYSYSLKTRKSCPSA